MGGHAARDYWEEKGLLLLWFALLAPVAAWALDQLVSYAIVKPVCAADARVTFIAINAAAFALVLVAATTAWSCLVKARGAADDGPRRVDRSYFMAVVALSFNVLIALLIVLATVAALVLSPCE
jgi:hypothetical protein